MKAMVSVYDAKAHLSRLIAQVEQTSIPVVISRHGKPVVDLVPHRARTDPLTPDPSLRGAVFHGDPTAPLDSADWPEALR